MKAALIRWRAAYGLILCSVLAGCGGGGGSGSGASGVPPSLSALILTPTAAYVNTGTITVTGTANFTTTSYPLASATVSILDASGNTVSSSKVPIQDGASTGSGQILGTGTVTTATAGTFTIQIYVTDTSNQKSNTVSSTFRVADFPWTSQSVMPTPRLAASVVAVGHLFYVLGGLMSGAAPASSLDTVEIFDASTANWSTGIPLPVAMQNIGAATVGGKIYVVAGNTSNGTNVAGSAAIPCSQIKNAYEFDPTTQTWSMKSALPTPTDGAGIAVIGTKIYVIGGTVGQPLPGQSCPDSVTPSNGQDLATAQVMVYDTASDTWAAAAPLPSAARLVAAEVVNGKIEAFGGASTQNGVEQPTLVPLAEYDPATNTWSARGATLQWTQSPAATVNGALYAFSNTSSMAYDPVKDAWEMKEPLPNHADADLGQSADVYNGSVYLFDPDETFVYNPANDIH